MKIEKLIFLNVGIGLVFIVSTCLQKLQNAEFQVDKTQAKNVLAVLPKEERRDLEVLFEHFFFFDQFSYPLFGSKPMSLGRLLPKDEYRRGWQAWKKISSQFASAKFIIRESRIQDREIILIANLERVEAVYHQNRDLFETSMSLDELIEAVRSDDSLFEKLVNNDVYLGLLLGYGRENSIRFANGDKGLQPFSKGHPIWSYFSAVMPVYFACDLNSEETKELKSRYSAERDAILKRSKKENLFTAMLLQLINP